MKTIGLLGGLSWESTAEYYRILNTETVNRLGPTSQPPILLHSFDFSLIAAAQRAGQWDQLGEQFARATLGLVEAGAELLGICANTMHLVAEQVVAAGAGIPLVHIVEATASAAIDVGARTVGLLGTAYTMENPFYANALREHNLDVVVPEAPDRAEIHRIVYEELILGVVRPESRQALLEAARRCADRGAEVVLLACTELAMLVKPGDPESAVPLVDTTREHCRALLDAALA